MNLIRIKSNDKLIAFEEQLRYIIRSYRFSSKIYGFQPGLIYVNFLRLRWVIIIMIGHQMEPWCNLVNWQQWYLFKTQMGLILLLVSLG